MAQDIANRAQRIARRRRLPLPPGPRGYPIIGNITQLDTERHWHTFVQWKKEYGRFAVPPLPFTYNRAWKLTVSPGDIVHFRLFNQSVILLNTAKATGDLLDRRASNYSERPRLPVLEHLTGGMENNIISANHGPMWRSQRRAAHNALNMRVIKGYYPIQMREAVQLALDMLDSPNNWMKHTHRFASIESASVIYNDPSHGQALSVLTDFLDTIAEVSGPGKYLANHIHLFEHVPECFANWKKMTREKYELFSEKFLFCFKEIKGAVLRKEEIGPSFCATMSETHDQHGLNETQAAWLAAVLYSAGYETTANALGWLLLAMASFPEVQQKVQAELDSVIGRTRIPTLDDMVNLPYYRAVVKEVLRWRPPVPFGVFHGSKEDDVYEGYYIPKGSAIVGNILAIDHEEMLYGPNPNHFIPERFLNPDGTHKPSPADTKEEGHFSFGFGRRICPGRHLANNALLSFAVVLWAMIIEPGSDADGGKVGITTDDRGHGILSRANIFVVSTRNRFPEAAQILVTEQSVYV
ncbi:hypothetical protein VNI00_014785 [Paramarasmius palmivorus]|uniref:Cytochrome P450 n=1 Tax=Paramarasmius palmivorus TaxID=297713 RepID=A0AAW0BRV0_9AGAR